MLRVWLTLPRSPRVTTLITLSRTLHTFALCAQSSRVIASLSAVLNIYQYNQRTGVHTLDLN